MDSLGQLGLFCAENNNSKQNAVKAPSFINQVHLKLAFESSSISAPIQAAITDFKAKVKALNVDFECLEKNEKPWFEQNFIALDVETTGLDAAGCRIIELALVPFNNLSSQKTFSSLFNIGEPLPSEITKITGIDDTMLENQPSFADKAQEIIKALASADFIVAYNAKFDRPFVESEMARLNLALPELPWVDPYIFVSEIDRFKKGKKLVDAAKRWGVDLNNAHRAQADAQAAGELLLKLSPKIEEKTLEELLIKQKILGWQQAQQMAEYRKTNSWSINR